MPFIMPENIAPQEDSAEETIMNSSSAPMAIHTPAGCRPIKAMVFFVPSAVFFAALRVFSAAFFTVFAPCALTVFAYCFLIRRFCIYRENGLEAAICGLSWSAFW